jgi:hypothetical protein
MALSQAAAFAEKLIGHGDNATTEQDITNPAIDRAKYADPSGETMKALVWNGKNSVKVRKYTPFSPPAESVSLLSSVDVIIYVIGLIGFQRGCTKTESS